MNGSTMIERDPAEIEAEIVRTRASLHNKLHELERRLNPKARVENVRRRLNPEPYLGWAALAAIGTGLVLGVTGWRRRRASVHALASLNDPAAAEMMGE